MKNSKFISAFFLSAIVIIVACKKEEPIPRQIPPSEIKSSSSLIFQYGKDIPIEGVTVNLKKCNGAMQWVWGGFFGSWQCDEPLQIYKRFLPMRTVLFLFDVDTTLEYEFYKQGYWSDSGVSYSSGSPNTIDSTPNKHFLIKNAWLKIHFSNLGSPPSVDSIIIMAGPGPITANSTPFANLYLPVYGDSIDNITYTKAYGDAANYVKWGTTHNGHDKDSIINFSLNAGDTALVEINY